MAKTYWCSKTLKKALDLKVTIHLIKNGQAWYNCNIDVIGYDSADSSFLLSIWDI